MRQSSCAYMPSPLPRWNRKASLLGAPCGVSLPRISAGSASTSPFSGPAQRSLSLRPACSPSRFHDPLHRRLRRLRYLHHRLDCYRPEQQLPGGTTLPLEDCAFSRRTEISGLGPLFPRFQATTSPRKRGAAQRRHHVNRALRDLLSRLAVDRPMVLALDDIQINRLANDRAATRTSQMAVQGVLLPSSELGDRRKRSAWFLR